jgi:hypothetical protein
VAPGAGYGFAGDQRLRDDFFAELFFEGPFFEELFLDELFFAADFFFGTFAPSLRASDSPMAIACFRLVTFLPLRPLFSVPLFFSRIARATFFCAFGPYFLPPEDFFCEELFFVAMQASPFSCIRKPRKMSRLRENFRECARIVTVCV